MSYDVCISYNHFTFDNSEEAIAFAEMAKKHYFNKHDVDEDVDVSITIKNTKEED